MTTAHKLRTLAAKHPAVRAGRYELGLYRDLIRWARGRTDVPEGAKPLPHPPGRLQMLSFLTAVLLIELVAVHLLLPSGTVQLIALLLSLWGIVFVWGLVASERVRPSYIDDQQLVLRRGRKVFATVPLALVSKWNASRSYETDVTAHDGQLTIGGSAGTDTQIILLETVPAAEDTYPWQKKRTQPVRRVRFYAGGVL
ncbi:hypothetical protein KBX17_04820 [Corynebacterium sp. CCUG 65737]|uniref:hypothetical protein n=1 Tax=unclassified Corynebacterium TaxID=2624378 RepID=UPI00210DE641|nr:MULTISPECIES: hypothetical protein [unclassified Corynebacterium]MCQ4618795.1 hypothetical protein [Corynebacterium pseudogenitalium]MCQ4624790.1 hypothetical protein [Corynebacterium sp. CCUG 69979]MCQ4627133.1 hypothetical protein [Corynebacterium sp. CCUG 65737]